MSVRRLVIAIRMNVLPEFFFRKLCILNENERNYDSPKCAQIIGLRKNYLVEIASRRINGHISARTMALWSGE